MNLTQVACLVAFLPMQSAEFPSAKAPPRIARFLEQCETTRRGVILQLEHELRRLKNVPSPERSPIQISRLESRLQELQSGRELVVPAISFPPQPGAIGRLPGETCYVDQVISPGEVLVRCHFRVPVTTVRNFRAYRDSVNQPVTAVIRGWKQRISEGQDVVTQELFEVIGRERYETRGGAIRTVLVLEVFDRETLRPYLPKMLAGESVRPAYTGNAGG